MTVLCLNKKSQSKRNLKLFTFILLFGFIGIFSSNNAFARVDDEFEGICIRCGGTKGTYKYITNGNGEKFTMFTDENGNIELDSGHATFGIEGNDGNNPLDNLPDLQSDMYMHTAGSIQYSIISNPSTGDVTVEVIDPATNQTLQSLSVASEAQIDASGLVPHQPYAIVSTTEEGAIEVKTIKVSETELFINTDDK